MNLLWFHTLQKEHNVTCGWNHSIILSLNFKSVYLALFSFRPIKTQKPYKSNTLETYRKRIRKKIDRNLVVAMSLRIGY